jgi:hypothetical protein
MCNIQRRTPSPQIRQKAPVSPQGACLIIHRVMCVRGKRGSPSRSRQPIDGGRCYGCDNRYRLVHCVSRIEQKTA